MYAIRSYYAAFATRQRFKSLTGNDQPAVNIPDFLHVGPPGTQPDPFFGIHFPALMCPMDPHLGWRQQPLHPRLNCAWTTLLEDDRQARRTGQLLERQDEDPVHFYPDLLGSPVRMSLFVV